MMRPWVTSKFRLPQLDRIQENLGAADGDLTAEEYAQRRKTHWAQRFSEHQVPAFWANTRGPETIDVSELSASITPATLDTALEQT